MEKHIEIQKDVYNNCIDYKKAFDRVWNKGLWSCMANFGIYDNISQEIINITESYNIIQTVR